MGAGGGGRRGGEPSSPLGESKGRLSQLGPGPRPPGGEEGRTSAFAGLSLSASQSSRVPQGGEPRAQCLGTQHVLSKQGVWLFSDMDQYGFPSPEDPLFPLLQSFQISNRHTLFKLVLPYFLTPPSYGWALRCRQRTELSLEAKQQANLVLMANIYWILTLGQAEGECITRMWLILMTDEKVEAQER